MSEHHAHGRARAGRDGPGEHAHRHARLHQPAVAGRQHHARLLRPLLRPLHVQRGARARTMACSSMYNAVRARPLHPGAGPGALFDQAPDALLRAPHTLTWSTCCPLQRSSAAATDLPAALPLLARCGVSMVRTRRLPGADDLAEKVCVCDGTACMQEVRLPEAAPALSGAVSGVQWRVTWMSGQAVQCRSSEGTVCAHAERD